jgi:hypothetical protein
MNDQVSIQQRKEALKKKLEGITRINSLERLVAINSKKSVNIQFNYHKNDFWFDPGDLIRYDGRIGIVVGVGIDIFGPILEEELWFLFEGDIGISHITGARADFFKEKFTKLKVA